MRPAFAEDPHAKLDVPGVPMGVGIWVPIFPPLSTVEAMDVDDAPPCENGFEIIGAEAAIDPPVIAPPSPTQPKSCAALWPAAWRIDDPWP